MRVPRVCSLSGRDSEDTGGEAESWLPRPTKLTANGGLIFIISNQFHILEQLQAIAKVEYTASFNTVSGPGCSDPNLSARLYRRPKIRLL